MWSVSDRLAAGKALREATSRASHGSWQPADDRLDPIALLEDSNQGRIPELIPIRYGRMLPSAFAFLRGSAIIMAADLATTPTTGLKVQACGDAHLLNFGGFASPERNLIFGLNDFDETLPAPWEWDVKRLVASVVVAGREMRLKDKESYEAAKAAAQFYRHWMREYSKMRALEIWYARLDAEMLIDHAPSSDLRDQWLTMTKKAFQQQTQSHVFLSLTTVVDGQRRLIENPPLIYHPTDLDYLEKLRLHLDRYRETLQDHQRVLLDRYQLVDAVMKVVGVGSVGTHCGVALLLADDDDPLLLQFKEARTSVLEPYAGKSIYSHPGQRVVEGQRLMQSASDIFLGWATGDSGYDFYVRQLWDMKSSIKLSELSAKGLTNYAGICGWALARDHACSGEPAMIAGYLGKSDACDRAFADFALAYADQVERDHSALVAAVDSGRIHAIVDNP